VRCIVIQTAFLGDAILTLPLVSALAASSEVSWLGVLAAPAGSEFLSGQGVADTIITYDKRGADRGLAGTSGIVAEVRRSRADVALIPHRSFRSALIPTLAGVPERVGFDVSGGRALLTETVPYARGPHEVERVYSLGEVVGLARHGDSRVAFRIRVPDAEAGAADGLLVAGGAGEAPLIVVAPGSRWATKRWLPERFAQVADRLSASRDSVTVIVGSDEDRRACSEVERSMKTRAVNLAGELSIGAMVAVLARAELLVSNDSAAAHVAAGLGTPVVTVFGPTVVAQGFSPYTDAARVAEARLPCRPCGRHGGDRCRLGTTACMSGVSAEAVLRLADELLGEDRAHA
jgi:heptosyltransferase-2